MKHRPFILLRTAILTLVGEERLVFIHENKASPSGTSEETKVDQDCTLDTSIITVPTEATSVSGMAVRILYRLCRNYSHFQISQ